MEFLTSALAALPQAATSGVAATLFVVLVVAWLAISWRVSRNRELLKRIKDLPADERANVLKAEMGGAYLKTGMPPEAFLQHQRNQNFFIGYLVTLGAAFVFAGFVVYLALGQSRVRYPDAISVGMPEAAPLWRFVEILEKEKNLTVVFGSTCAANVRDAAIDAGEHEGTDRKAFLEGLQSRTKAGVRYRVLVSGVANERLEIDCY